MCTDFSITTTKKETIIGRSMELGLELNSELFFRSVGSHYEQNPDSDVLQNLGESEDAEVRKDIASIKNLYNWTGCYGFVGMNGLHQNIAANGMNTEGLTTGTMVLAQSKYQSISENDGTLCGENVIFYPYLTSWILSNCKDCQDVIDSLHVDYLSSKNLKTNDEPCRKKLIVADPFNKIPAAFKFHFPVHDAGGKSIVLEFVDGKLTITDLAPIGVLTNDPLIAWQQENVINNFANLSPVNRQNACNHNSVSGNNFTCNTYAQGTGFDGLPGSSTPVDRFVRAAMITNFAYPVANAEEATTLAFHILNTVDIPRGTSRETAVAASANADIVSDFTQWITVSDLSNKVYSIRMYGSPEVYSVDLKTLNLMSLDKISFPIPNDKQSTPITSDSIIEILRTGSREQEAQEEKSQAIEKKRASLA